MTVETEVAALTTAVNSVAASITVPLATLTALKDDAAASAVTAEGHKDTAAGHDSSAQAAASAAAATAAGLAGFDLDAIAESKAVTAVDVFVYDTSKDSDGGAWRKRTQGTSWYQETLNTATRGARREFPAVAVIVAAATTVTLYDGDDPTLPMWMVFGIGAGSLLDSFNSVSMLNGILCAGSPSGINYAGLLVARFLNDDAIGVRGHTYWNEHMSVPSISARNGTWQQAGSKGLLAYDSSSVLCNANVNDVAMTVLPGAPIDPRTGLAIPTIAVGTAGGVSVITSSGAVYDSAKTTACTNVTIMSDGKLLATFSDATSIIYDLTTITGDGFTGTTLTTSSTPAILGTATKSARNILGSTTGLTVLHPGSTLSARITASYNTGWVKNPLGIYLCSTDTASLVASGELVTNGDFATDTDWTKGTGWTIGGGTLNLDASVSGAGVITSAQQQIATVVGKTYRVTFDVTSSTNWEGNEWFIFLGSVNLAGGVAPTVGSYDFTVVAQDADAALLTRTSGNADGNETLSIDNISVKLADADRSVNNNGLTVNGTITRTEVATGAEKVGYGGWSASNYLEQPYNSDLDYGTGDFTIMGWVKPTVDAVRYFYERFSTGGGNLARVRVYRDASGFVNANIWDAVSGTVTATATHAAPINVWSMFAVVRESGVLKVYVNSILSDSVASTEDLTSPSGDHILRLGVRSDLATPFAGSLALLRISATAPTPNQIAKIYEDEKVLFQENAQATLYGASDAVTALAHDDATNLLHVGTSAGRSVFQGLRRVSNTTTAVGTAISASNGLVVEE